LGLYLPAARSFQKPACRQPAISRIAPPVIQEIFVNFSFMPNAPVRRALLSALALYRSAFAGVPTGVEQTRVD